MEFLKEDHIYNGDSRELLKRIKPGSISLSFWSPPYFLGKEYEKGISYEEWQGMLKEIIESHYNILKPGGFLVINIADILSFVDESMPRIMGLNPANRKCSVTLEMVLKAKREHPDYNRNQLA
ncbi:MAG: site-specific DNA-methyltransferase, partial [Prevotella sp.]|nr:site-specific DNA-methyltransferase [Prevotella sp.]